MFGLMSRTQFAIAGRLLQRFRRHSPVCRSTSLSSPHVMQGQQCDGPWQTLGCHVCSGDTLHLRIELPPTGISALPTLRIGAAPSVTVQSAGASVSLLTVSLWCGGRCATTRRALSCSKRSPGESPVARSCMAAHVAWQPSRAVYSLALFPNSVCGTGEGSYQHHADMMPASGASDRFPWSG